MATIQKSQYRRKTQRPLHLYQIPLQLRYKTTSKVGTLHGFGRIRMMSSKDIIFGPGPGLEPGMTAEVVVDWPRLLEGRIHLKLMLGVMITGNRHGVAEARIMKYDFRTCKTDKLLLHRDL